jgi:hypothetical protein
MLKDIIIGEMRVAGQQMGGVLKAVMGHYFAESLGTKRRYGCGIDSGLRDRLAERRLVEQSLAPAVGRVSAFPIFDELLTAQS